MMNIKAMLNEMKVNTISDLEIEVINSILNVSDDNEELKEYMENVMYHGCQSGIVGDLIYTYQCNDFFKKHFEEIFDLYNDLKEELNLELQITATDLSWFSYEAIVNNIYNALRAIPIPICSPIPPRIFFDDSDTPISIRIKAANGLANRL